MIKPYIKFLRRCLFFADMVIATLLFPFSIAIHNRFGHMLKTGIFHYIFIEINWNLFDFAPMLIILVPIWYLTLFHFKAYDSFRTKEFSDSAFSVIHSCVIVSISYACLFWIHSMTFFQKDQFNNIGYSIVLIYPALCGFFMSASRLFLMGFFRFFRRFGYNLRQIIIVGTGRRAIEHFHKIQDHAEWGLHLKGFITLEENDVLPKKLSSFKSLGTLNNLDSILRKNNVDEIFFIVPRKWLDRIGPSIMDCDLLGITTHVAIDLYDMRVSKPTTSNFYGLPVLSFNTTSTDISSLVIKRLVDIIGSFFGIIVFFPFALLIAVMIKLSSKGPVFFTQKRCGMHGRIFPMLKFRTMVQNAEKLKTELMNDNEVKGPIFKIKDDPRVTTIGKFLRKSSLDEMPQLVNVLLGHMSLVGPRPPLASEVKQYQPWQRRKLSMRPGITCIWQVSGRNDIPFEQWMELDLRYIDNWSLMLDFKILLKTIPSVLSAKGNY